MTKFIKLKSKNKKEQKIIINAASKGKVTAYIKHSPTGALIPVTTEAIDRMKNGETLAIEEAERTHDRNYFKLPFLAIRWGMDNKECLEKLLELQIPCFFNPNEVEINDNSALVGQEDICIFQEYIDAVEKKLIKKKKDVRPEFI